ncbi:MAG: hypothetical protein ACE15C_07590 [Phycisphaerae bacterium]
MRAVYEFRVPEQFANRLFRPDEGRKLKEHLRLIHLQDDDPRLPSVGTLQRTIYRETGRQFYYGWSIHRLYDPRELECAPCFLVRPTAVFGPCGQECRTKYDESSACPRCGSGARRAGPLVLQIGRIPRSKDFAQTIARGDEIVVSRRAVELFQRSHVTGVDFEPVRSARARTRPSEDWFVLNVRSAAADIVPPTRVGVEPFDDDHNGGACPLGDLLGLNLLSEVYISAKSRADADFVASRQYVGMRNGLLRPQHVILISQTVRRLIESENLTGLEVEVAHVV